MPSLTTTRQRPPPTRAPRRRRGSDVALHPILGLQQTIGNRAVGRILQTATMPSRATVESRLSGGRWFRRSETQRRILKWIDRWHAGINAATPAIRLAFLDRMQVLVDDYKASKAGETVTTTRTTQISGLNTLLFEIGMLQRHAEQQYQQTDDLPGLTDLDGAGFGALDPFNTSLARLGSGALNTTYTAAVDTAGTEAVFKPEKAVDDDYGRHRGTAAGLPRLNPNQTGRAVGTYRMAQLMGVAHVVPPTYYASFGTVAGQVMAKVHGTGGFQMMDTSNFEQAHWNDRFAIYWLDLVCGQVDRHAGNFMLETDGSDQMTGRAFAIDNDLAFGNNYGIDPKTGRSRNITGDSNLDINGKEARSLAVDPAMAERIIRLARNQALVRGALHGLLTVAEITATLNRLSNLAAYLTRRLAKRDNVIGWT